MLISMGRIRREIMDILNLYQTAALGADAENRRRAFVHSFWTIARLCNVHEKIYGFPDMLFPNNELERFDHWFNEHFLTIGEED